MWMIEKTPTLQEVTGRRIHITRGIGLFFLFKAVGKRALTQVDILKKRPICELESIHSPINASQQCIDG